MKATEEKALSLRTALALVGINMVYASVAVFTKLAAQQDFLSWAYIGCFAGAIAVMGLYAVLWQQVLRYVEIGVAYMFKGTSLIFTMLVAAMVFGEQITTMNIVGSAIIISGVLLLARS